MVLEKVNLTKFKYIFKKIFLDFVRKCSNIVETCECIKETFKFKEMDFIIEEFYEGKQ